MLHVTSDHGMLIINGVSIGHQRAGEAGNNFNDGEHQSIIAANTTWDHVPQLFKYFNTRSFDLADRKMRQSHQIVLLSQLHKVMLIELFRFIESFTTFVFRS